MHLTVDVRSDGKPVFLFTFFFRAHCRARAAVKHALVTLELKKSFTVLWGQQSHILLSAHQHLEWGYLYTDVNTSRESYRNCIQVRTHDPVLVDKTCRDLPVEGSGEIKGEVGCGCTVRVCT